MLDIKQILQRTNIQELRSLLLEGIDLSDNGDPPDIRTYEQRCCEGERPIYELLEQTFPDEKALDNAVEKLSSALLVNENIYMEIGMRAGVRILFRLLCDGELEVKTS